VNHRRLIAGALIVLCGAAVPAAPAVAADAQPITDLRVLAVTDASGASDAIVAQLAAEGVPHTVVSLTDPGRPAITAAFLASDDAGVPHARFQAVVLPSENPFTDPAELTALHAFERQFGVRQVDSYVYPSPATGQNWPSYAGPLDGTAASLTPAALAGPFGYLRGPVPFEDVSPSVQETWGAISSPLPGAQFEPVLTAAAPGGGAPGVLAGILTADGRSELALNFAANPAQRQFQLLAHGIVGWATGGTYLGHYRNYLSVHVDDVFLPDSRWSPAGHCTPGEDCVTAPGQPPVTTAEIRMGPADVGTAIAWQATHAFTLDLLYNGGGSDEAAGTGQDPLAVALLAGRNAFRWANHTLDHAFLGCVPDYTIRPWRCTTGPGGEVQYVSEADIASQVSANIAWARVRGILVDPSELVTGEHSGLRILPQQPADNPNLAPALAAAGVRWTGSDASREPAQRAIGDTLTLPRHPVNIFYNAATQAEEVSEYNWLYTSRADGGSGICEDNPATTTCIAPLDQATGFAAQIVPTEVSGVLAHVLSNDPRPHFVHQSNLTGDRIAYPVLDGVLATYRTAFAENTPLVSDRIADLGAALARATAWQSALTGGTVSGYLQGGIVHASAPEGVEIPLALGSAEGTFGTPYAGGRSGWQAGPLVVATVPTAWPAAAPARPSAGARPAARRPGVPQVRRPAVVVRGPWSHPLAPQPSDRPLLAAPGR
jgi:hypothetical protein